MFRRRLILLVWAVLSALPAYAQREPADSLVRLIRSDKGELQEIDGQTFRKLTGDTRFLHNNTYLMCDTALWNVNERVIQFRGHVRIIQDQTSLTSDRADYFIDRDLAEFRGSLVELMDRDGNVLRTRNLDYNTADSVAVFQDGAAMRDKDGQLIESITGTYDARDRRFTFTDQVNMFSDSIFVRSSRLLYRSDRNTAYFGYGTDAWQGENMLSANDGWYDRSREMFLFRNKVHVMSAEQEGWADTLIFHRADQVVEMLGHAVVLDTTRKVAALGGHLVYVDSLSRITLMRRGAMAAITEDGGQRDTVWVGADTLVYWTVRRCDLDSLSVMAARERLKELSEDAIGTHRRRAAEAAAKAAQEALEKDEVRMANRPQGQRSGAPPDTLGHAPDTLGHALDSLGYSLESQVIPVPPPDTTAIGFARGKGRVRLYRASMQLACDSLLYSDLDSLARLFGEPKVWQESTRQYSSDSIAVVIRDRRMDRAHLMSSGFITIQETESYYDQIRGTELVAYFTPDNKLRRFDGLGGVDAIFFLQENDAFATVNKVQAKMLSALFENEELDRIYYFEQVGNNAYPIVQLPVEDQRLKGFNWAPDERPDSPEAVTPVRLRDPEREKYAARPHAEYRQTEIYFPGFMDQVYRELARRDSLKAERARRAELARKEAEAAAAAAAAAADTLSHEGPLRADGLDGDASTVGTDSTGVQGIVAKAVSDSGAIQGAGADSTGVQGTVADTLSSVPLSEKERRKLEREAARAKKEAEREARWAAADARDAEKARIKAERKQRKERERKRRELKKMAREREKEQRLLEKYKAYYERRRAASMVPESGCGGT